MTLLYDWLKKAAKVQGNTRKALRYRDNYLSWRGLLERVDRRAQEFGNMGIKDGDWVGLMLGNVPDFVILALALSRLGAAIVPIDPTTGSRELELVLAAAPLRALVTRPRGSEGSITASGAPAPAPVLPPRGRSSRQSVPPPVLPAPIPAADAAEVRRRLQGTLLTCSVFKRPKPVSAVDPLAVLFTSDSLGDPKGLLRTEKNTIAAVDNAIAALEMDAESRILVAVPLFHAYGWDLGLLTTLKLGCTMFLEEEVSARRIGKLLREHSIDVLPGTPQMYAELSRLPTAKDLELTKPRYLAAGLRLGQDVADEFAEKYGVRLWSCYHSTEAATVALDDTGKNPTSVGKVIAGVEVRITGPDGKPVSNKDGLFWVKSKSLSPKAIGPYDEDAQPARASGMVAIGEIDKQGWLRTGDLAKMDKSGRVYLTGREDDVVKVEGKRVALGEVEGCLESFSKIKAAQALVVTDPMTGAVVVARVVARAKCGAEEVIDHCAKNLAPYKVPRRIEFVETILMLVDRARGRLLGGAIGDALGYPVEFISTGEIGARFGAATPARLDFAGPARISDDTQMTMFVAEGVLRGGDWRDSAVRSLLDWYETQGDGGPRGDGLLAIAALHARRAPGNTNMAACRALAGGARPVVLAPGNDSKGCGAVMRAAPWGIAAASRAEAFVRARDTSVLTHGHPSGYLSAAHLAAAVWGLVRGEPLSDALAEADALLADEPGREELVAILAQAYALARKGPPSPVAIEVLGGGWTGEEAHAIAIVCALTCDRVEDTLWRAALHGGDSDSTAAICGNLLGALLGVDGLPASWVATVELSGVIDQLARDLAQTQMD